MEAVQKNDQSYSCFISSLKPSKSWLLFELIGFIAVGRCFVEEATAMSETDAYKK